LPAVRCPLCGDRRALRTIASKPYAEIWAEIEAEVDAPCSEAVRVANSPASHTRLVKCGTCDLGFFWPIAAGDASFYAALTCGNYYNTAPKWEFGWVLAQLPARQRVLDVGCGPGDFLVTARDQGYAVAGLETDANARARACARDLDVHGSALEQFSCQNRAAFDTACAFHVLEHVSDPLSFVRHLADCVRPGGRVVVSVPNAERTWRAEREPLEFPPHHVTRWTMASLRALATHAGMRVETMTCEPCAHNTARHALEKSIHARIGDGFKLGNAMGAAVGFAISRALLPSASLYDWLGLSQRLGLSGLSVVAVLRTGESNGVSSH
jgi:SAM-dependent methyltransferase